MKKNSTEKTKAVKSDVRPAEVSHLKNGHKWLAWIMGITAVWMAVIFIMGLGGSFDLPQSMNYLNIWYLVNIAIIAVTACCSMFAILSKSASQIFWSAATMFVTLLQSISLLILFFIHQDTAAINAILMFVWSICWYAYMVTSPAVESDLPSKYRSHSKLGEIYLCIMTLSTVAFGVLMVIILL